MNSNLREKTKFIYFRIINASVKNRGGQPNKNHPGASRYRKDIGPLTLPPASLKSPP